MVNPTQDGCSYSSQDLNFPSDASPEAAGEAEEPDPRPSDREATTKKHGEEVSEKATSEVLVVPDGKESVEFQIGNHVADLFDVLEARAQNARRAGSRRYQLVHNNALIRHVRGATAGVLSGPGSSSSTTVASGTTQHSTSAGGAAIGTGGGGNADISLAEVLDGLQYVVDYRLRGRQQPRLDRALMGRLCDALMLVMAQTQGSFLNRRLSDDARTAYFLFGQFIEEVGEFQQCVGEKPVAELRRALQLHQRIGAEDGDAEPARLAMATMVRLVLACLPPGNDWRDLVDEHEQRVLAPTIGKYSRIIEDDTTSCHMPVTGGVVFPPPALYFDRTVDKLVAMFVTDIVRGLRSDQVDERRAFYGRNELPRPVRRAWWLIVWDQLTDLMILMLCAAIVATAVDGEWKSSIVLAVVVVLNTIVGAWQEIKAGKALSALENLGSASAQVVRDGTLEPIDAVDLVPGDVVEIGEGETVPADLRLTSCAQLEIVESVLTGESVGVIKDPRAIKVRTRQLPLGDCKGNAFMSTLVAHGRGRGVVIRTGTRTEIGKISVAINRSAATVRKTPIQKKLTRLGLWLVVLALSLCAVIVVCGVAWGRRFVPIFITGISLAVSVIPEGLVAVTTVTMALGVRRMARRNALMRTLPAVETLGGVTTICSDKTGTLTEGKMGLSELVDARRVPFTVTCSTSRDPGEGEIVCADTTGSTKYRTAAADVAFAACALCNNAEVWFDEAAAEWTSLGDPTEVALTIAAQKAGLRKAAAVGSPTPLVFLVENAFDSDRKRMSVVYDVPSAAVDGKRCVITLAKGAPEEILSVCSRRLTEAPGFLNHDDSLAASIVGCLCNNTEPLSPAQMQEAGETCEQMAARGLRVLAMAAKVTYLDAAAPVNDDTLGLAWAEDDLVFAGLAGLIDPPRAGIVDSIRRCHDAGIKVIMITGDHIRTATAIAESIGIVREDRPSTQRMISGAELDLLSDEAAARLDPFPTVFARVSPENKIRIVRALQQAGHVTAMTGDGVNDSAAVKAADIGVAMGLGGTDLTKQAADMVLLDDNFTTIVAAVEEGRRIFDNIAKFILYLLSCNTAEIVLFLFAAVLNLDLPFTTIMILWANIIADIPPALSLGMDPPESNIMARPPRNPRQGVLTRSTTLVLVIQAFFMASVTFAVFLVAVLTPFGLTVLQSYDDSQPDTYVPSIFKNGDPEVNADDNQSPHIAGARSIAFGVLTALQLNQAFLSRSIDASLFHTGLSANKWMVGCVLLSFALYILGVYTPGLNDWLELVPLGWEAWLVIFGAVVLQVVFSELVKLVLRTISRRRRRADGDDAAAGEFYGDARSS
ncbi:hypothetical protein GGF46_001081 [Coemansia sp. RSA 552]|nr:hypothetical protein GGF46_001081 [Coemansia sp. RSA 552]